MHDRYTLGLKTYSAKIHLKPLLKKEFKQVLNNACEDR